MDPAGVPEENVNELNMKVKSPLMSIDARGAMGPGVVLGKYRGTNTGRMRIRTPIRRSSKEQAVRNNLIMGATAWGLLSESERLGWNTYAKTIDRTNVFGQIYHATGQAEYLGNYTITRMLGKPAPGPAPEWPNPGNIEGLRIEWNEIVERVYTSWVAEQNIDNVELLFTPILSNGRMSTSTGELIIHDIRSIEIDHYSGPYLPGAKKVIFKIRGLMDSGQWGPWIKGIVPPGYP